MKHLGKGYSPPPQMLHGYAPQQMWEMPLRFPHMFLVGDYCFIANLLAVVKTDYNNGVGNKRAIIGSVV